MAEHIDTNWTCHLKELKRLQKCWSSIVLVRFLIYCSHGSINDEFDLVINIHMQAVEFMVYFYHGQLGL